MTVETPAATLVEDALAKIDRAHQAVSDLCSGKLRWEMRVPAEPDHDPDLIISDALMAARKVIRSPIDVRLMAKVLQNSTNEAFGPITDDFWLRQAEALAAEYDRLNGVSV